MKFRFLGGLDCPDWILAEVAALSKLSVIKFKNWCLQCVNNLIAKRIDWTQQQISSLNSDGSLGDTSLKAMLAALLFIFEKSIKNSCSPHDLELEMQQLGFPVEHCKQLIKVYTANLDKLKATITSTYMRGPSLSITSQNVTIIGSNKVHVLNLQPSNVDSEPVQIAITDDKLRLLHKEMSEALNLIRPYVKNTTAKS